MARRLLLNPAAEVLGVTPHFLRTEARAGRLPVLFAGNRYIFDVEQVEEFLKKRALENVKAEASDKESYGVLRKIAT